MRHTYYLIALVSIYGVAVFLNAYFSGGLLISFFIAGAYLGAFGLWLRMRQKNDDHQNFRGRWHRMLRKHGRDNG